MSSKQTAEYTIYNAVTPQTVTSSTDASPSVVTKASHGYVTGDRVVITGHATNTTVNGIYDVVRLTVNTFTLKDIDTGADINGAGGGAGSGGIMCTAPKVIFCEDFMNAMITVITSGTATLNFLVVGSDGRLLEDVGTRGTDRPNFGGTINKTNPYQNIQIINQDTGAAVNGVTGIAVTGTDINIRYELNINGIKYFTLIPNTYTQGVITVKTKLYNNQ
jgi:hypothetical protein